MSRLDDVDRFIDGAMASADRAAALTRRMLAFARRQPLAPQPVLANPLVESMEELLRRTVGERITLEMALAHDLWLTHCDPQPARIGDPQSRHQCARRDARRRHARAVDAHVRAGTEAIDAAPGDYVCRAVADTGLGCRRRSCAARSSRSTPPRRWARAPGWGSPRSTASSASRTAMRGSTARSAEARPSGSICRGSTARPRRGAGCRRDCGRPDVRRDRAGRRGRAGRSRDGRRCPGWAGDARWCQAGDGTAGLAERQPDGPSTCRSPTSDCRVSMAASRARMGRSLRPGLKVLFMTGYGQDAAPAAEELGPGMALVAKPFKIEAFTALDGNSSPIVGDACRRLPPQRRWGGRSDLQAAAQLDDAAGGQAEEVAGAGREAGQPEESLRCQSGSSGWSPLTKLLWPMNVRRWWAASSGMVVASPARSRWTVGPFHEAVAQDHAIDAAAQSVICSRLCGATKGSSGSPR